MESYEKKYKNALEWARQVMNGETGFIRKEVEEVFPELAESKDEKIRRNIIAALKGEGYYNCDLTNECISWLEKQQSVEEIVERCKNSWYNEGKIAGMAEGLSDDEKYQQGWHDAIEKQGEQNPYSGVSFKYNGHTWGMCARDGGVEISVDGKIKERVFIGDKPKSNTALEGIKEKPTDNANKVEPKKQ